MSRLVEQIRQALVAFEASGLTPALIGGLALAAHRVVRATQDVDFLLDAKQAEVMHASLLELGYRCVHRSEDAANYVRGDEGLDLIYAHRPIARRMLTDAEERDTPMGRLRVVGVEGLIALKLQGFVNDPRRTQDLEDIRPCSAPTAALSTVQRSRTTLPCSTERLCSMNSTVKTTHSRSVSRPEPVLVREGGVRYTLPTTLDPFQCWVELMEVVESLCPTWPRRPSTLGGGQFKL